MGNPLQCDCAAINTQLTQLSTTVAGLYTAVYIDIKNFINNGVIAQINQLNNQVNALIATTVT